MSKSKYQEGQVVKIKSYEELKEDKYQLLYSDEWLKEVAEAEVAIYKVISDLRVITWYQVGQWGHNVIEIPEAYIKGEVFRCNATISEEPSGACSHNFLEFSNQVRDGVNNGEYPYQDTKELLEGCLEDLESKQDTEDEIKKVEIEMKKFLSDIWRKASVPFSGSNGSSKFKPGMLVYDSAAEVSKDESAVIKFLKVPENYLDNIPHSKTIIEAIRKYSAKEEVEMSITFEQILTWIERELTLFSTRWYSKKLREEGVKPCLDEIKSLFDSVKSGLSNYGEKCELPINSHLVTLAMFAIQTIIYLENPKEIDLEKKKKAFYDITNRMLSLYKKKNKDYGNSFDKSLDEDGLLVAKIRIGDKVNRYCTLIQNNGKTEVKNESLIDTLIDMANYCVMTIKWIEYQPNK